MLSSLQVFSFTHLSSLKVTKFYTFCSSSLPCYFANISRNLLSFVFHLEMQMLFLFLLLLLQFLLLH